MAQLKPCPTEETESGSYWMTKVVSSVVIKLVGFVSLGRILNSLVAHYPIALQQETSTVILLAVSGGYMVNVLFCS